MAYRLMIEGIAQVSDEGLRRSYLGQVVCIARSSARGSRTRAGAACLHNSALPIWRAKSNLREPFERLVDTGLRLNELRSAAELHEFLIDEATELSGAERVLLVLESPEGLQLAGSLVPRGEDAEALLRDVDACACTRSRRTRAASLAHVPDGAPSSSSARASSRR